VVHANGSVKYYVDGVRHREGGPACVYVNGTEKWYRNGLRHRDDGPAATYPDGRRIWFIDGVKVSDKTMTDEWPGAPGTFQAAIGATATVLVIIGLVGAVLARVLLSHEWALAPAAATGPRRVMEALLGDGDVRDFLGINRYRDVLWFSQERFEALVAGLQTTATVLLTTDSRPAAPPQASSAPGAEPAPKTPSSSQATVPPIPPTSAAPSSADLPSDLAATAALAQALRDAEEASAYQIERLLRLLPITPVRPRTVG